MKVYEKYRDSGVAWLGEVPAHWEVIKGKYVWKEYIDLSTDGLGNLLSVSQYDGVRINKQEQRAESLVGYKKVQNDHLVINIMLAWLGGLGLSSYSGLVSPAYSIFKPIQEISTKYFHYLYRTSLYLGEFARKSTGVVPSRWRMYGDDFGQVWNILPPLSEQTAIATFLDSKCEQLDKAIAQKERVITLLNERRQIIIQRAVTRGLNPDIPLRDSGIDWIGEIPEHWEVKRLKYIANLKSGEAIQPENISDFGEYPIYGGNGHRGYTTRYTNEGYAALIGRQGALCGNVNYAKGKFYASEHAIVVYPLNKENVYWLGEIIKIANFNRLSQSAAQPGISVNIVKNVIFCYPPVPEQTQIANYLDSINEKIDRAITLKKEEILRLKEYKQVLINSAVMGKIKIE